MVISAGALESTRLLLEFDESSEGSITRSGAPLGRYFADHLSVSCGRFVCRDWRRYNLAVAPIFENGLMRTPRLELTGLTQKKLGLTSSFAHFNFVTHGDTGFDVVRNFLRRRQGEQQSLGLSPALGSDSPASNKVTDIWREMQLLVKSYPNLEHSAILAMATLGGAKALRHEADLGCLSVGKKAKFIHVSSVSLKRCSDVHQLIKELVSGGKPTEVEWV